MRAFPFILVVAMLGAVSLATVGAISTVTQTRHNAIAFSLARVSVRDTYDGRPAPAFAIPVSAVDATDARESAGGGPGPFRTIDR